MNESKKETKQSADGFVPLLEYLENNKTKLDILLSGEQGKPLVYPIKGKRKTRTFFISESLQNVMADYCLDKNIKIGDFVESAIINHLMQKGYEDKIKPLLNATVIAISTKDNSDAE